MNNLRHHKLFFIIILTTFGSLKTFSQTQIVSNSDQETIDLLVERKMAQNNQFSLYPNFSIQLKNGTKEEAESIYKEFSTKHPLIDATIIFANPKFKVVVGNFKNKIEAVHLLEKIKVQYPEAFVVKLKQ